MMKLNLEEEILVSFYANLKKSVKNPISDSYLLSWWVNLILKEIKKNNIKMSTFAKNINNFLRNNPIKCLIYILKTVDEKMLL